ncbi:endoribonuclease ZC3H12A-like [Phlebotomus papatasi]|uniref:endoribonuclease ZC3H12A-like n=1 Tax=Phlebotomus papatasi TaxID=29031 RepID=UPI00248464D8|nr:endoribonuclease ZC3H12A-like [Phlebotomus papatasi]
MKNRVSVPRKANNALKSKRRTTIGRTKTSKISRKRKTLQGIQLSGRLSKSLVVIDGTNVAMTYGHGSVFSVRGIQIALQKLKSLNKEAIAIVPQKTMKKIYTDNHSLIHSLADAGDVLCAPGKNLPNGTITECNPERFILDAAYYYDGNVLSNSEFDKIAHEKQEWKNLIQSGRIQKYQFNGNELVLL